MGECRCAEASLWLEHALAWSQTSLLLTKNSKKSLYLNLL